MAEPEDFQTDDNTMDDEDDYKRKIRFIAHARQPYGRFIETIVGTCPTALRIVVLKR